MENREYSITIIVLIILLFIQLLLDLIFFVLRNYNIFMRNVSIFLIMQIITIFIIWIFYLRKRFSYKYKDVKLNNSLDFILGIGLFIIDILITLYTAFSFSEIFIILYAIMAYIITQQKERSRFSKYWIIILFPLVLIYHFFIPIDPAIKYFL